MPVKSPNQQPMNQRKGAVCKRVRITYSTYKRVPSLRMSQ